MAKNTVEPSKWKTYLKKSTPYLGGAILLGTITTVNSIRGILGDVDQKLSTTNSLLIRSNDLREKELLSQYCVQDNTFYKKYKSSCDELRNEIGGLFNPQ